MFNTTYNFSELTPESQRLMYLRLAAFDVAANWLATFTDRTISEVRLDLLREAFVNTYEVTEIEIADFFARKSTATQAMEISA